MLMPECGCGCCKTMFSHDLRPGKGPAWLEMARVTLQAGVYNRFVFHLSQTNGRRTNAQKCSCL